MIEIRTMDGTVVVRITEPEDEPPKPPPDRSWLRTELVDATPRQQRCHRQAEDRRNIPNLSMYGELLYQDGEPAHYRAQPPPSE